MPREDVERILAGIDRMQWLIRWFGYPIAKPNRKLSSSDTLREMRLNMARKKGVTNGTVSGVRGNDRRSTFGGELRWVNLPLDAEDVSALDGSDATVEFLVARLVSMGRSGVNWSVRSVDSGESVCCTFIGSDPNDSGKSIGLSSFGDDFRDAVLCAVYRFDVLLDGQWDNIVEHDRASKSSKRFR